MDERADPNQPDGSEPGGAAGADTIEQSAGVGPPRETSSDEAADEIGNVSSDRA